MKETRITLEKKTKQGKDSAYRIKYHAAIG
jgi:hypothetical protein